MADQAKCAGCFVYLYFVTVFVLSLVVLRSTAIPAQTPADCKKGENDATHEVFDISQLRCTPCAQSSQFQTVSADGKPLALPNYDSSRLAAP